MPGCLYCTSPRLSLPGSGDSVSVDWNPGCVASVRSGSLHYRPLTHSTCSIGLIYVTMNLCLGNLDIKYLSGACIPCLVTVTVCSMVHSVVHKSIVSVFSLHLLIYAAVPISLRE